MDGWSKVVDSVKVEDGLLFVLRFDHQVDVRRKRLGKPLASVRMSPPLHDSDCARAFLAEVELGSDTLFLPSGQNTGHELGKRRLSGGVDTVVMVVYESCK